MSKSSSQLQTPANPDSKAADEADTHLGGRLLTIVQVAWIAITVLMIGLTAAGFPAQYEQLTTPCQTTSCANEQLSREAVQALEAHGLSLTSYAVYDIAREVIFVSVWLAVAALIFWRCSSDRAALVVSFFLVTFGVGTFTDTLNALADAQPMFTSLVRSVEVLGVSFLAVALLLFPDGRFVPRWTGFLAVAFILLQIVGILFPSSPLGQIDNGLFVLLFGTLFGTIILAQVYRYRRISGPVERQQTKWAVSGIVAALVGFFGLIGLTAIVPALARTGSLASILTESAFPGVMLLIPLSFGMAILRSRLWDIDLLINRALVYSALTTIIVGLYVLVVGALGTLLQARGNLFISLLGAGLVAVLFQPLRERLQRTVNHRMYGERDDPYAVLSRLGERLEATLDPEAVLSAIVETVREALRLPYATIVLEVDGGPEVAASSGEAVEKPQRLPLTYQNEHVGKLLLAPRAGEEDFSEADRRLLEDLSRQAGIAAHAVRLTADLQRARERLVSAREEERRRLRRDLHDGLGPQLSSQTLTIDAVRSLMRRDPDAAEDLLVDLKGQAQDAISDIRRLVYSLRPPALDDLGLLGALRESAAQYGHNGLDVRVEAPEELTSLPAAVEVAAYRIAQESVTNVARHAHAGSCIVSLAVDEAAKALCLEVRDDGRGMPEDRNAGVGLASMRERAAELGGRMIVEALPEGGTIVRARVPLPEEASDFEQQTTEKRSES